MKNKNNSFASVPHEPYAIWVRTSFEVVKVCLFHYLIILHWKVSKFIICCVKISDKPATKVKSCRFSLCFRFLKNLSLLNNQRLRYNHIWMRKSIWYLSCSWGDMLSFRLKDSKHLPHLKKAISLAEIYCENNSLSHFLTNLLSSNHQ